MSEFRAYCPIVDLLDVSWRKRHLASFLTFDLPEKRRRRAEM